MVIEKAADSALQSFTFHIQIVRYIGQDNVVSLQNIIFIRGDQFLERVVAIAEVIQDEPFLCCAVLYNRNRMQVGSCCTYRSRFLRNEMGEQFVDEDVGTD